jgi:tetratricopeptide (TPR) repeat protein
VINLSEVSTVMELRRQALKAVRLLAAVAVGGSASVLSAQARPAAAGPPPDAPRLMVPTFRSSEKNLGVDAAEVIRTRISRDLPPKSLWVIPKNDIKSTLEASGYDPNIALSANDAKELAKLLRADEVLQGTVTKAPEGYKVDARLMLARDVSLVQPLPAATGAKLDDAAKQISRDLQAARKQLAENRKCENFSRERKYPEAIAAARAGIVAYPQATLARICLANVYVAMKQPPDSIVAITEAIRAIDPRSRMALTLASQAYKEKGDTAKFVEALTQLMAADPTNVDLRGRVVAELARSRRYGEAKKIIDQAVAENPGDPDLTRTQWLVNLGAESWKDAIRVGESIYTANDTATIDTTFFVRLGAAYASDSQPQKAVDAIMRGIAKYPNAASLHITAAQMYRSAGQLQQAIDHARKALALNPKIERGYLQIAQAQIDLNQPDSALASLHQAVAAGDDKSLVSQYALSQGNSWYKKGLASKSRGDYETANRWLAYSDSVAPSPEAKFLLGVSNFYVGQMAATEAGPARSCDLARVADAALTSAQINVAAGGSVNKDAAGQVLGAVAQLVPFVEKQKKAFCKNR